MKLLIELIFKGTFANVNLIFLKKLVAEAKEIYFNSPEISSIKTFEKVIETLISNTYVDLVITTDNLHINKETVSNVFINLERNDEKIEVLFYFDLNDLNKSISTESIDYLMNWMLEMQHEHNFQYFICQMDNADKNEYYFDSNGIGELYKEISR